jgi:hypothetical protein
LKILITGAASAKAYQLKNSLNVDEILLGDYADLPILMLKAGNMVKLPNPADASYSHKMLAFCLDNQVDTVYALGMDEWKLLNEAVQLFKEYGITIYMQYNEIYRH